MQIFNKNEVKLNGIGVYIPHTRASNLDILDKFDLSEHFIKNKVGFVNRSVKQNETTTDLCCKAFEDLVTNVKVKKDDITILIVVTQNPEQNIPHTSAIVHNRLGLSSQCMTFDISQGCAGFIHGLAVAKSLLKDIGYGKAVLITADPYSNIVNPDSKSESIIFGDAATASLLSFEDIGYNIGKSNFGTAEDSNSAIVCTNNGHLVMNGHRVSSYVIDYVIPHIKYVLDDLNSKSEKADLCLMHQGSKYVVELIRTSLNVEEEKMPFLSRDYGNTVSSSIPIMLKDIFANKKYKKILIAGFGVGFTWGHCLLDAIEI